MRFNLVLLAPECDAVADSCLLCHRAAGLNIDESLRKVSTTSCEMSLPHRGYDSQREYDLTPEDIRAALKFVGELAEQESFNPLRAD